MAGNQWRDGERIALFIDGANLHATAEALGFDVDYKRLLAEFRGRGRLLRACYFAVVADGEDYCPTRPLIDWLGYNGYAVVAKPVREFVDASGRRMFKRNIDVEIAVAIMEAASHVDRIVLFAADGNLRAVVRAAQRRGVRVTVVSTARRRPGMIAEDLLRQADEFIEVDGLVPLIGRIERPYAGKRPSYAKRQNAPGEPYF